jgi:hypothetical protein
LSEPRIPPRPFAGRGEYADIVIVIVGAGVLARATAAPRSGGGRRKLDEFMHQAVDSGYAGFFRSGVTE